LRKRLLSHMAKNQQTTARKEKSRLIIAIVSSAIIIALLTVYAYFSLPGMFKPRTVTVTGAITASGVTLEKITFVNTGCGTISEANILYVEDNLGSYTISVGNEYSYDVTITWGDGGTKLNEAEMGILVVDTFSDSFEKDWVVQPQQS
jgi:hypothetical protein